jgi:hypothetical protein
MVSTKTTKSKTKVHDISLKMQNMSHVQKAFVVLGSVLQGSHIKRGTAVERKLTELALKSGKFTKVLNGCTVAFDRNIGGRTSHRVDLWLEDDNSIQLWNSKSRCESHTDATGLKAETFKATEAAVTALNPEKTVSYGILTLGTGFESWRDIVTVKNSDELISAICDEQISLEELTKNEFTQSIETGLDDFIGEFPDITVMIQHFKDLLLLDNEAILQVLGGEKS